MNARTAFQLDPLFDASCDATREWREVSCMDGDEDRAEALFSSDFEEESRGADDCGPLREVFDLIGLRVDCDRRCHRHRPARYAGRTRPRHCCRA